MKIQYGLRNHSGGLKESLETTKWITYKQFKNLQTKYDFYGFDTRVNQLMFIRKNLEVNYKDPTWLFIQIIDTKDLLPPWKNLIDKLINNEF